MDRFACHDNRKMVFKSIDFPPESPPQSFKEQRLSLENLSFSLCYFGKKLWVYLATSWLFYSFCLSCKENSLRFFSLGYFYLVFCSKCPKKSLTPPSYPSKWLLFIYSKTQNFQFCRKIRFNWNIFGDKFLPLYLQNL